jgi:hypothetical protein
MDDAYALIDQIGSIGEMNVAVSGRRDGTARRVRPANSVLGERVCRDVRNARPLVHAAMSSMLHSPPHPTRRSCTCAARTGTRCVYRFCVTTTNGLGTSDGNLGTRLDRYGYGDNFLPVRDIRIRFKSRQIWNEYFFPPTDNLMDIRYFTIAILLGYKQVKRCSFYYINYDLF